MLFKTPAMEAQHAKAHPELREAMAEADATIIGWGLPPLMVTEVERTPGENFAIYFRKGLDEGLTEAHAKWRAERQFSYHLCLCAEDFRSSGRPWTPGERDRIFAMLRARCPKGQWGLLLHDAGTGLHFHLEAKDFLWRRNWEQRHRGGGVT